MVRRLTTALAVLAGLILPVAAGGSGQAAASAPPCGTVPTPAAGYTHVVWIWMENHAYGDVIGSPQAPYINGLAASCGLATNYHNVTHPSLPNYVAATSGLPLAKLSRFSSDCNPSRRCSSGSKSIFGQGETWSAYEESMTTDCQRTSAGEYAVRHNPAPYYRSLRHCTPSRLVPGGPKVSYDVPFSQLATDLADAALPALSFVTPNLIDDMHDGTVAEGDAWLAANLPTILQSQQYQAGQVVVFVTWDEGESGTTNDCAANVTDAGCHVATVVVSPSTPAGTASSTLFSHYSLLRTTEELLGLPLLGQAASATSMRSDFGL